MTDYIKQLESKVRDCNNTNTIFDTRKYVLLEDAKEVLNQALTIPVVSNSVICCPQCGNERLESTGRGWYICCDINCDWGDKL
jgi:ribosomal protein S27E